MMGFVYDVKKRRKKHCCSQFRYAKVGSTSCFQSVCLLYKFLLLSIEADLRSVDLTLVLIFCI